MEYGVYEMESSAFLTPHTLHQKQNNNYQSSISKTMKNLILFFTTIMLVFAACSDSTSSDNDDETDLQVEELRNATSSFHDIDNAIEAGWSDDITGCMEDTDDGGMGHHFANLDYFDGRTTVTQPQALMYEPQANGDMEFVGVEYIIPFDVLPDTAETPVLFGQEYSRNYVFDVWALHAWTEKENPSGLFADWNPDVSCEYAEE